MQISKISMNQNSNFNGKFTEIDVLQIDAPKDRLLLHRVLYNPYKSDTQAIIKEEMDTYRQANEKTTFQTIRGKRWKVMDRIRFYCGDTVDENSSENNL